MDNTRYSKRTAIIRSARRFACLVLAGSAMLWHAGCAGQEKTTQARKPVTALTPDAGMTSRFQQHVEYLASDELEGRGIGSDGIAKARDYIAAQFTAIGLEPVNRNGSYLQTFDMTLDKRLTSDGRLSVSPKGSLKQGIDYRPMGFSSNDEFSGEVVFCGYGIVDDDPDHDDFVHVDLKGKVALMLFGEPDDWADENGYLTRAAFMSNKVYNAKDRGAVAVIFVNQAPENGEVDTLRPFDGKTADEYGLPAMQIKREVADALLASAGKSDLQSLQSRLDQSKLVSGVLAGIKADGYAGFERASAPTSNVIGLLHGEGQHADEWIAIGAHYDHLGIRKPMGRKFKAGKRVKDDSEPQIHNGADDNASGVAGLIEIARMFAKGPKPKRSILFLAFTAEETGLHGSKYLVKHCPVPLESTVAMLNMDMIGRLNDEQKLIVFGTGTARQFPAMLDKEAAPRGLVIAGTPDPGGRSDHAAFFRENIPSLHFNTGGHSDYHKPTDDAYKINFEGGARVAQLVHDVAVDLADLPQRPAYLQVESKAEKMTTAFRVVMGLTPNYSETEEPGMGVDAVSADGPADIAGMKGGDRIIQIEDKKVANIYDYMAATRNNKPGDSVRVIVMRDGKKVTLNVTLAGAGGS